MLENYKNFEGKEVHVFWKSGAETYGIIEKVNNGFLIFKGALSWVSCHTVDDMELVEAKNVDGISLTTIEHPGSTPTPDLDENSLEEIEVEIEKEPIEAISKRLSRPCKKPKAYQRYGEGGIWYVHHGNGAGINVKGQGDTLEEAYYDWKVKHTEKQGQRK